MKPLISLFTAIAIALSLSSCDELANMLQVEFPAVEVQEIMDISTLQGETRDGTSMEVIAFRHSEKFFDLSKAQSDTATSQGKDLSDYLNSINEVNLEKLAFVIIDSCHLGQIELPDFSLDLDVSIMSGTQAIYTETFEDVKQDIPEVANLTDEIIEQLSTLLAAGTELEIVVDGVIRTENEIENFYLQVDAIASIVAGLAEAAGF